MLSLLLLGAFIGSAASQAPCQVPAQAQVINPRNSLVLNNVPPPSEFNASNVSRSKTSAGCEADHPEIFLPPGLSLAQATAKPFHIYDDAFYKVIGSTPTLTLLAESASDPLFHEAVIWYPPTDEVFFCQNSGAAAAGTGLNKSAIIEKISLAQAAQIAASNNTNARVNVTTVNTQPTVINPNGQSVLDYLSTIC